MERKTFCLAHAYSCGSTKYEVKFEVLYPCFNLSKEKRMRIDPERSATARSFSSGLSAAGITVLVLALRKRFFVVAVVVVVGGGKG